MQIDRLNPSQLAEIRTACSRLFPKEFKGSIEFIERLDAGMLKRAYRNKAKSCHPDLHPNGSREFMTYRFQQIHHSYRILNGYMEKHAAPAVSRPAGKGKIIAIGGAKGGVGKSIFTSNLGVFLASKGFKTVVVDLDLGGANLHLYLGEKMLLKKTINDFLRKRAATLQEVMTRSPYGPLVIGGDSSELGSANIPFVLKLKLLRAIQTIEADFVLIDLGGDTAYNILDFFLSADYGVVISTCESAAYIGAYHFIKAAMLRKFSRMFGPESVYRKRKDRDLDELIRNAVSPSNGPGIKKIEELKALVKRQLPQHLPLIDEVISGFHPTLVINRVTEKANADQVARKLQGVSKTFISKNIEILGSISTSREIEKSAMDLVPAIVRHPNGHLATEIERIAVNLLGDANRK